MTRRRRRIFIGSAVFLGVLGVAVVVASIALGSFVRHRKDQVLAQLGERLGRKVTVGRVSTSILGGAGVTVDNLTIAGDPTTRGDEAPLLTAERVRVRVALLRAITSLGHRVTVSEIVVRKPQLNLVRLPDGTLNVERVAQHWQRSAPPSEPSKPMSERMRRTLESARIGETRIDQGRARFVDLQQGGRIAEITAIDLALRDLGVKTHPTVQLRAALMAAKPNLDLHAQLGEAARLEDLPPRPESVRLALDHVDLTPLTPLIDRGAPFHATLDADVTANTRKGDYDIRRLEVAIDHPDLDRLRRAWPAIDPQLRALLHGPARLRASATGNRGAQRFQLLAKLTDASIDASGRLEKNAIQSDFKIAVQKSDLAGSLAVRDFARPQIDLRARSSYLDTADLLPRSAPERPARSTAPNTAQKEENPLARVSGHIVLSVARGVAEGVAFDHLETDLTLRDGAFHLAGQAANVEVAEVLHHFGAQNLMSGRLTAKVDVRGRGTAPAELERTLTGTLDGTVSDAQLLAFSLQAMVANKLVEALPFHLPVQRITRATQLGTVNGQLHFADGAIMLDKPLHANTPEGALELSGRLFFDGRLDLTGSWLLTPTAVSSWFGNRVRLTEQLPLSLKLGGDIHHPSLGIPNLADLAQVLLHATIGNLAGEAAKQVPNIPGTKQAADQLKNLFRR